MKKGKREQQAAVSSGRAGAKTVALGLILAVVLVCAVGGTAAWLSARTSPVVNTFTYGDINITLTETDTGDGDEDPNTNEYKMMPGKTIAKDPRITVLGGSEDCWLFVGLEKSENFDDFMTYEMAEGWTALDEEEYPGVYYREVTQSDEDQEFQVILEDTVTVKDTVTKDMLNALNQTPEEETYPTLTVTAYAVQYDLEQDAIASAGEAWKLAAETGSTGDAGGVDGAGEALAP